MKYDDPNICQNFAYGTTAQLSWHVQNSDIIGSCESKLEQRELSNHFNNEHKYNGPGSRNCVISSPKKIWTEVINMDYLALGLTETHPSDRKAWSGKLRSAVRLDPPLY